MERMKVRVAGGIALSLILWTLLFNTTLLGNFWARLTAFVSILLAYSIYNCRDVVRRLRPSPPDLLIGVFSGLILYLLFWAGYNILSDLVSGGASAVYELASGVPLPLISLILVYTSVGEEVFWRGFIQDSLGKGLGRVNGLISATLAYSLIHLPTLNTPLILAALIAGGFWGALYLWRGALTPSIVSHIVWTELVFVLAPLGG